MTATFGGVPIRELADRYGTPLNVMDGDVLVHNLLTYRQSFDAHWPGPVRILPAIKANTNVSLLRLLSAHTDGCDLFSEGEFWAAQRAGFDPTHMSLNGNSKLNGSPLLRDAVAAGVRITLDDLAELPAVERAAEEAGTVAHVRLRMRPDVSRYWRRTQFLAEPVSTHLAMQAYKAGMPAADLLAAGHRVFASPHLTLTGLHVHVGRHRADLRYWHAVMRATAQTVVECSRAWDGWLPRELDIGGGFAAPGDSVGQSATAAQWLETSALHGLGTLLGPAPRLRNRLVSHLLTTVRRRAMHATTLTQTHGEAAHTDAPSATPSPAHYAETVCDALLEGLQGALDPREVTLEIEPGRALFTDAGAHVATVTSVKQQQQPLPWTWVMTDTSTAFLADSLTELCRFPVEHIPAGRARSATYRVVDVVGISCNADRIVADAVLADDVTGGDLVVFHATGAYNEQSAGNFNSLPRPATVLVRSGDHRLIRRRERIEDIFSRDLDVTIPDGDGT